MALLSPTFIFGIIVLLYLSSFVVFAVLRILTGISIQRVGYFSLRRLAYTPRDGIRIEIRGLGINLHRPTFAQPTWVSVVLTELAVTVDLALLEGHKDEHGHDLYGAEVPSPEAVPGSPKRAKHFGPPRSKSWKELTKLKDRIKRLHRQINWIRLVDVVATNSLVRVLNVGTVQIGSYTMAVDTRRKLVDRRRMFLHRKRPKSDERPAEWMFTVRSVLFTPDGGESLELVDHATLNIHGLLYKDLDGLREAAIALKLGRVNVPFDDIQDCVTNFKRCLNESSTDDDADDNVEDDLPTDILIKLDGPGGQDDELLRAVSDSKEFISSILRGIKGVQFAVSYVGLTKRVETVRPAGSPIYLNASMKEVGIELHRLDPKTPAHRMYFSSKDIAHQALAAALSLSVAVDDGQGKPEQLIYIPMATTTVRTTLPSKTVQAAEIESADERNANILFANFVVTSPSVDLDPKHLPLIFALALPKPSAKKPSSSDRYQMISRLLPKAIVKFSMQEPVIRITLPPVEPTADEEDFDLIISSISSVSLDVESSHSAAGDLQYSLGSSFRVQSHDLYYQTSLGTRYDLVQTESMELKVQMNASPEVQVVATGTLQTFSARMIRPEISAGVRQIVRQLRTDVQPDKRAHPRTSKDPNFLRTIPFWLLHFQFQASDFSAEVAGIDSEISEDTRGVALQFESWSAEYRAQRMDSVDRRPRRRSGSKGFTPDAEQFLGMPQPLRKKQQNPTDGRRLAVHIRGLEAFVVESADKWEFEPFLAVPRFEVAVSTSSDNQGQIFHINSHVKTLLIQYSLYRHYAFGVATTVLMKAFVKTAADRDEAKARAAARKFGSHEQLSSLLSPHSEDSTVQLTAKEMVTVDVKAMLIQIKANMPADPPLMIQVYGFEAGRHRWSPPFFQAKLARLYAEAPRMRRVWARLVSIKTARLDLRENKRKLATGGYQDESLIDVNTEAIRIAIPHQLVFHKITNNIVNVMKASKQLHHRFKTGTNEYILENRPKEPRILPKISIRSKALLFEIEDGAFEWKLGLIYRAGLVEQQQRLAREAAFCAKAKKIHEEEQRRDSSKFRPRPSQPRRQSAQHTQSGPRSRSDERERSRSRRRSRSHGRHRRMRYDPDGVAGMSAAAKISTQEAEDKLHHFNAQSWKKRIDHWIKYQNNNMKDIRGVFWGPDNLPDDMEDTENILEVPPRPALMATLISDLHLTIDKPSFPLSQLPDYLHRIGKGMPQNMKYSLLIPMSIQLDMGEAKMTLRDYPLPLLHVPAMSPNQSSRLPSWSLKTDFVIAEEFRGPQSMRSVKVEIVPPKDPRPGAPKTGGFAIDVRRTISPVKSYSDLIIDINTGFPTRITWGASYQPAVQDMMMVFEGFTKPQADPSDRTGFWDKIRLSFHSRALVSWKGDGDMHLMLKGTRDPYAITGNGAGFLMGWRNDVRWSLWREEDPKKFMTVDSGDYILAIPDFSHQARVNDMSTKDSDSLTSSDSYKKGTVFKKVVMKLSGNVQWLAGIVFERNVEGGGRSFDFEPHYNIVLKEPSFAVAPPGLRYDAFRGFRSHHIHLSIAIKAPVNRNWSVTDFQPTKGYNTVHLSPRVFSHFFAWWSMFGGALSLPIRQGRLWPGIEKSSKKFGRHLATIKYNIQLAPLFLSHIYKHKEAEDYSEHEFSATGIKIRLDSFMLDVHQRREQFNTLVKDRKSQTKTSGMKIHKAHVDLLSADIRVVSASIAGTNREDLRKASLSMLVDQGDTGATDLSNFVIPDNDFTWIDMDDFVELDWILPNEANPDTQIMPLAYSPRFTYFRQTDHLNFGEISQRSSFGNEPTHFCIMTQNEDPRVVQGQLIQDRLDQLEQQRADHKRNVGEAELLFIRDDGKDPALKMQYEQMRSHEGILKEKHHFLESMRQSMATRIQMNERNAVADGDKDHESGDKASSRNDPEVQGMDSTPAADFISDFNNRFVIHNMQLKWNNSLRNTLLRYIHQVSQRRGFVYYLSRRAVKFILDIVEDQNRAKTTNPEPATPPSPNATDTSPAVKHTEDDAELDVEQRIRELLADSKKFVNANDPEDDDPAFRPSTESLSSNIGEDFSPQSSYHLRLIAPQIQLQSEKNTKAAVIVTAKGMELKVIEVMDKDRMFDDVSGLVQRRFSVEMDSTQFFVTEQKWFSSQLLSVHSGSCYGASAGTDWPPWVPMEVMFDFQLDPFGFKRVVQKTSASLRYDKYNTLRLKYNDEVGGDGKHNVIAGNVDSRMDHLWVAFPQIKMVCDSSQYYAMYVIVLDLLLWNEPLEKTRTERLEKIMLASDFSDLRGAPEMVIRLQERIRQLEVIKNQFQIHSKYLDKRGWEDRILLQQDLSTCEDELFFLMKAITTSQRKYDGSQSSGLLRWNIASDQIVWHLMREKDQPLAEFQLQKAEYDRTDNSDGSHVNLMQIGKIIGLNLLPDAIYPEMIAPYLDGDRGNFHEASSQPMFRVYWYMLEAIAGIPVMDHFEVNLFPMKMQLEREIGKRLFEYVFPGSSDKTSEHGLSAFTRNITPLRDEDDAGSGTITKSPSFVSAADVERLEPPTSTVAGSLELRLKPTLNSENRTKTGVLQKPKPGTRLGHHTDGSHFRLFHGSRPQASSGPPSIRTVSKKPSSDSLLSRQTLVRSPTDGSNVDGSTLSVASDSKSKRFGLHRNGKQAPESEKPSDDLTKMLTRASNYMTLAYVKIPSVVLCLSYKGKGERNLEDVHDFVFRMPQLEYRNKTWSNLDLALALKKDVIKALISHTGAIIGNKFTKFRPSTAQQSRLRELATSQLLLVPNAGVSADASVDNSDASSLATSPDDTRFRDRSKSPRRSIASSGSGAAMARTRSASSSGANSTGDMQKRVSLPSSMTMTPLNPEVVADGKGEAGAGSMGTEEKNGGSSGGFLATTTFGRKLHALGVKKKERGEGMSNGKGVGLGLGLTD